MTDSRSTVQLVVVPMVVIEDDTTRDTAVVEVLTGSAPITVPAELCVRWGDPDGFAEALRAARRIAPDRVALEGQP